MRCWTTKDTPGLSPLDRKNGLAVFSQGWTMGTVALGVFSVILVEMKWWRRSQPTKSKSRNGEIKNWFPRERKGEKKFQEARTEILCDNNETIKMQSQSWWIHNRKQQIENETILGSQEREIELKP